MGEPWSWSVACTETQSSHRRQRAGTASLPLAWVFIRARKQCPSGELEGDDPEASHDAYVGDVAVAVPVGEAHLMAIGQLHTELV